jgi:MFS family permease
VLAVRRARAATTFVFFAHGALFGTWVSRIPAVKGDLSLSDAELGVALATLTAGGMLALPLVGWLIPRRGSRGVMLVSIPVFALLLPALALAPNLPVLCAAIFFWGAAASALDVSMNAHGLAVEQLRGRPILSTLHAGWSLGGLVGASVGAVAARADVDHLVHFTVVAVVLAAGQVAVAPLLLPAAADRPEEPPRLRRPPRRLAALSLLAFCGLFAEGAAADWSAVYLDESLGTGAGLAALGFAAFSVAMVTMRLLGDRLTERVGPVTLTRAGGVLAASALAVALLVAEPVAALVAFACMGVGLATVVPIAFRASGSLPDLPPGVGIAALTSVGYSAFLVGPATIGFVAEAAGLPRALALVVVMLAAMAVLAPATRTGAHAPAAPVPAPR